MRQDPPSVDPRYPGAVDPRAYAAAVSPRRRGRIVPWLGGGLLIAALAGAGGYHLNEWDGSDLDGVTIEDAVKLLDDPTGVPQHRLETAAAVIHRQAVEAATQLGRIGRTHDGQIGHWAVRGLQLTATEAMTALRDIANGNTDQAERARAALRAGEPAPSGVRRK